MKSIMTQFIYSKLSSQDSKCWPLREGAGGGGGGGADGQPQGKDCCYLADVK